MIPLKLRGGKGGRQEEHSIIRKRLGGQRHSTIKPLRVREHDTINKLGCGLKNHDYIELLVRDAPYLTISIRGGKATTTPLQPICVGDSTTITPSKQRVMVGISVIKTP